VAQPQAQPVRAEATSDGPEDDVETEAALPPAGEATTEKSASGGRLDLERMKGPLRTALRLALAVLLFFWILNIWNVDLPIGEAVVKALIKILLVVLICYVAWGIINAAIMRRMHQEMPEADDEQEEGGAGGSRIATLLLLLRKFMLVVIIVMAVLIVLSALGVNIGPLIAGAGVFGLAIGFGAQTLVKDIISGVFFLMDDAFRVGDYVECSGTKGSVEHISLRSLRLRNPRGQVYFIPFGDIKLVTNLSRDYVIMKLDFRVRYDADVEKIRKIIKKKVYQPIQDDPELGPKLLEPIKSQGVREMDDSAMIMRVKYKTKPGDQFAIRREVYRLMQEAFKEAGIEFAHRNVTVYMPPETGGQAGAQAQSEDKQKEAKSNSEMQRQAAAGAALAAIQAEEEKMAKQKPEK
jgi:small-conductance mechanosensitive channel